MDHLDQYWPDCRILFLLSCPENENLKDFILAARDAYNNTHDLQKNILKSKWPPRIVLLILYPKSKINFNHIWAQEGMITD